MDSHPRTTCCVRGVGVSNVFPPSGSGAQAASAGLQPPDPRPSEAMWVGLCAGVGGAHEARYTLTEQVTSEWGSEDLLRQKWEDLKKEHREQRRDSMISCPEKGPLSRVPGVRCRKRLVRTEAEEAS